MEVMAADRDVVFFLALGGLAVAFGCAAFAVKLEADRAAIDEENTRLQAEVDSLRAINAELPSEEEQAAWERRVRVLTELGADRGRAARYTVAVEQAVPRGAWLTELRWTERGLQLEGRIEEADGAAGVMDGLRTSGCFDDVVLLGVSGGGDERTFTVTAMPAADCPAMGSAGGDPFVPPVDPGVQAALDRPPILRWEVQAYDVVFIKPGDFATLRTPDGDTQSVSVGSWVGNPMAKVTFITEDRVLLTQDTIVDEDTQETRSRVLELALEPTP